MRKIMQNTYDKKFQEHYENVEQDFKPSLNKYNLKPPKPTKANEMRTRAIVKKQEEQLQTMTKLNNIVRHAETIRSKGSPLS
jgi:hypothetical protein